MSEKSTSKTTTRISSFVFLVVFVTLALSLIALISGAIVGSTSTGSIQASAYLLLALGLLGIAMSTYVLVQTRRRLSKLKIIVPPVNTTVECKKCGIKNIREFQRGDYIFKETEPCQKCNDKMLITSIFREVKEKEKERFPF